MNDLPIRSHSKMLQRIFYIIFALTYKILCLNNLQPTMSEVEEDTVKIMVENKHQHRWSGWPGAFCLKCGHEDPLEIAMADGWVDFVENPEDPTGNYLMKWDTKEHEELVKGLQNCAYPD